MLKTPIKDKDFIKVYTDGGCLKNPNGKGGYGVVIIDDKITEYSQGFISTTNNRMELRAFVRALEELKEPSNIELYTDSQYLCNPFNLGWLDTWLKSNWKDNSIKNLDLWKRIVELIEPHFIKFNWVKGHADNEYNNRCDELATLAYEGDNLIDDIGFVEIFKSDSSLKTEQKEETNSSKIPTAVKLFQLEKIKGDLNAYLMLFYNDNATDGGSEYKKMKKIINKIKEDLDNNK